MELVRDLEGDEVPAAELRAVLHERRPGSSPDLREVRLRHAHRPHSRASQSEFDWEAGGRRDVLRASSSHAASTAGLGGPRYGCDPRMEPLKTTSWYETASSAGAASQPCQCR